MGAEPHNEECTLRFQDGSVTLCHLVRTLQYIAIADHVAGIETNSSVFKRLLTIPFYPVLCFDCLATFQPPPGVDGNISLGPLSSRPTYLLQNTAKFKQGQAVTIIHGLHWAFQCWYTVRWMQWGWAQRTNKASFCYIGLFSWTFPQIFPLNYPRCCHL